MPWPGLWAVTWFVFLCPGCGLVVWFCLLPRAVGFCLVVLLVVPVCGCWVCFSGLIGCLCWLCPYVGVCFLFIRCFLLG